MSEGGVRLGEAAYERKDEENVDEQAARPRGRRVEGGVQAAHRLQGRKGVNSCVDTPVSAPASLRWVVGLVWLAMARLVGELEG